MANGKYVDTYMYVYVEFTICLNKIMIFVDCGGRGWPGQVVVDWGKVITIKRDYFLTIYRNRKKYDDKW